MKIAPPKIKTNPVQTTKVRPVTKPTSTQGCSSCRKRKMRMQQMLNKRQK